MQMVVMWNYVPPKLGLDLLLYGVDLGRYLSSTSPSITTVYA
jgi:hypothetical protein